jgi:hypothetical protein
MKKIAVFVLISLFIATISSLALAEEQSSPTQEEIVGSIMGRHEMMQQQE